MLQITIPSRELFDEESGTFTQIKGRTIQLEHSLVSLSKWESKWHKPFLTKDEKTNEETIDYVRCMTITQNVDQELYLCLSQKNIKEINDYIGDPMTATTISKHARGAGINREIVTSELIYYWMVAFNIPFECQKWHLNRLLTLIEVCEVKSQPEKKMGKRELMNRNAALNAARRNRLKSKG